MNDPIINYLRTNADSLITYFAESISSQPKLFPVYSRIERQILYQTMYSGYLIALQALESGEFEEVKDMIHKAFVARFRNGFEPNELLRMTDLTNDGIFEALQHVPNADEVRRALYLRRVNAIRQVGKMYIAILNLSIPSDERNAIDPTLLELAG